MPCRRCCWASPQAAADSASLARAELQEALAPPQLLTQPLLVLGAARHLRLQQVAVELHLQDMIHFQGETLARQLQSSAEPAGAELQETLYHGCTHAIPMRGAALHQVLRHHSEALTAEEREPFS